MADSPHDDSDDTSEIGSWKRKSYSSITDSYSYSYRLTHDISLDSFQSDDIFDNDKQENGLDNSIDHKESTSVSTDNIDVISSTTTPTPTESNICSKDVDRLEEDMIELELDMSEANAINKEDVLQKTQDSASYLLNILEEEKKVPAHKMSKNNKGTERGQRSHKEKRQKRRRTGRKLPQMPTSKSGHTAGSLSPKVTEAEKPTVNDVNENTLTTAPAPLMDAPSPDENAISTPPPDTPTTSDNSNIPESPLDSPESHIASESSAGGIDFNTISTHYTPFLSNTNMLLQEDSSPDEKPSRKPPTRHRSVSRKQPEPPDSSDEEKTGFHPATLVINGVTKRQTHRTLHPFTPRHEDEVMLEMGDPVCLETKCEDLWFEGINLRTGEDGCFPGQYVVEYTGDVQPSATQFSLVKGRRIHINRYHVKFLGSIEVPFHKGNDILCRAMQKVVTARRMTLELHPPTPCVLDISDNGVKMVDKTRPPKVSPKKDSVMKKVEKLLSGRHNKGHNYYFSLKNVSFCGFHPASSRYFAFITKHPTDKRFACHVFVTEAGESAKPMVEAMGSAFKRFYSEFLDFTNPTEDIYME